ncbi:hypothetical protein RP726_16335 [Candidatus Methylospira mobilis]|uniref:hypothetical protein n=1 Tax=Candidatus Methylospira mobilis TaxID=1808979 RepID=UPI0028E1DFB2|nr:hypothetical protein [Candidatus Methylospira mobilis]WNV03981.1 hypothetical protein RP726_16335 [Candidatus Methylospira mobilis]
MATNIVVNIVGGAEAQNTTAVTIGNVRWGLNGTAPFGAAQAVPDGFQALTVYKTTVPTQISITVQARGYDTTLNITVNLTTIDVQTA